MNDELIEKKEIHINTQKHTNLKSPVTEAYLELDVWIAKHNICFEFQDVYHYAPTWYYQNSQNKVQQEDDIKKKLVIGQGITLVVVPCWWDGTIESLKSTIAFQRPDLKDEMIMIMGGAGGAGEPPPIELNANLDFFQPTTIPNVGDLMLASFSREKKIISENAWWMGEKYDGIRSCWNSVLKKLYTRNGREISLPSSFTHSLPTSTFIDAECWFGRGMYTSACVLLTGPSENVSWESLRIIGFDNPAHKFQNNPFESRYTRLLSCIPLDHPLSLHIIAPRCLRVGGKHQKKVAQHVISDGGEGIIMRMAGSLYERGRSSVLVKIKASIEEDKEGIVSEIGTDNSVRINLPNGVSFVVPSHNVLRSPRIGDIVSFSFESKWRTDIPVNPVVYRIRTDLVWNDVVLNSMKERDISELGGEDIARGHKAKAKATEPKTSFAFPRLTMHDINNRRKFFEDYAKANGIDPQNPKHWNTQPTEKILAVKGAYRVISYHRNSVAKALFDLFPNIGLQPSKIWGPVAWHESKANRRQFFLEYAKKNGFDPLIAENWYLQPKQKIMAVQGASSVIFHHNSSLSKALLDLFPHIGLDKGKLGKLTLWHHAANRRKFFEKYAHDNKFDPLIPDNWYSQTRESILNSKGAASVIHYHKHSITKALMDLFPDVKLERSRLWTRTSRDEKEMRKSFFENYARNRNFNPLLPTGWYLQTYADIMSREGAIEISAHYGDIPEALLALFPSIGLEKSKLKSLTLWHNEENRRLFFLNYAKENLFDPLVPENWYLQARAKIMSVKGAHNVVSFHNKSIAKALVDLFPHVPFNSSRFTSRSLWEDATIRRAFFEKYAADQAFDPLHANNWYSHAAKVTSVKGAASVIFHHKNSIVRALMDLFPNIGLNRLQFPSQSQQIHKKEDQAETQEILQKMIA